MTISCDGFTIKAKSMFRQFNTFNMKQQQQEILALAAAVVS